MIQEPVSRQEGNRIQRMENRKSILKFIASHLDGEGKLIAEACELPDEGKDDEQLKFTPGFLDAMSGKEQSEDSPKRVGELVDLLEKIADKGIKAANRSFTV